jgi:hypothetical protein
VAGPDEKQWQTLLPWRGGLDTVTNPTLADPQFISRAENIEYGFDGTRIKRGGVKKLNQTPIIETATD